MRFHPPKNSVAPKDHKPLKTRTIPAEAEALQRALNVFIPRRMPHKKCVEKHEWPAKDEDNYSGPADRLS